MCSYFRDCFLHLFTASIFLIIFQLEELKGGHSGVGSDKVIEESNESRKSDVSEDPLDIERREKVKDAMLHAWNSYEKYAWGHDELQVCFSLQEYGRTSIN